MVQGQGGGQQGLQAHGAGRGLGEGAALVLGRGGGVGRGDHVDQPLAHRLDQGLTIGLGPQRRVQPVEGAIVADVHLVEAQVVDRDADRDLQPLGPRPRQGLERPFGRNLIHQEAGARLFDQGQVALQPDPLGDGRGAGQAQSCGELARGGHSPLGQPRIGRSAGDQGVEGGGVAHHPLQGAAVDDHLVAVGEIQGAGLVHQADLGHPLAVQGLGRGAGGANIDQVQGCAATLDEVDHGRVVHGGIGVGLDHDGRHAPGRGGQAGGLQRLFRFSAGFAGLDPNVDQAGRQAKAIGVDHLIGVDLSRTVNDAHDAAILDQDAAGAVIVAGGVQQPGVEDGEGGHHLSPQRADREASTAMRAATPIST